MADEDEPTQAVPADPTAGPGGAAGAGDADATRMQPTVGGDPAPTPAAGQHVFVPAPDVDEPIAREVWSEEPAPDGRGRMMMAVIIVLLAVLVVGGLVLWAAVRNDGKSPDTIPPNEITTTAPTTLAPTTAGPTTAAPTTATPTTTPPTAPSTAPTTAPPTAPSTTPPTMPSTVPPTLPGTAPPTT